MIKFKEVGNLTKELLALFVSGEMMSFNDTSVQLCATVLNTVDLTDEAEYMEVVYHVKKVLNKNPPESFQDVYIVNVPDRLTDKEKTVLIRLVNLAHKAKQYFIVLNGELIYIPKWCENYAEFDIRLHVDKTLRFKEQKEKFLEVTGMIRAAARYFVCLGNVKVEEKFLNLYHSYIVIPDGVLKKQQYDIGLNNKMNSVKVGPSVSRHVQ